MHASDIMTRNVLTVRPEAPILHAARLMLQNRVSGLPVVSADGRLVGMVSEGDFLRRTETGTQRHRSRWLEFLAGPGRMATEYVHASGRKVDEIMTPNVVTITQDTTLPEIVDLMENHRIKRLPVMLGGKVLGIVTRANLMHAVASLARNAPPVSPDDSTIRARVLAELDKCTWAPPFLPNVLVHDGTVDLRGVITDERQRDAIRVTAENTPGVKAVLDHLVWLEPYSGLLFEPTESTNAKAS